MDEYEGPEVGSQNRNRRSFRATSRRDSLTSQAYSSGDELSVIASTEDESLQKKELLIKDRIQFYILEIFQFILLDLWPSQLRENGFPDFPIEAYQRMGRKYWLLYISLLEDQIESLRVIELEAEELEAENISRKDNYPKKTAFENDNYSKRHRHEKPYSYYSMRLSLQSIFGLFVFTILQHRYQNHILNIPSDFLNLLVKGCLSFMNCAETLPAFFQDILKERKKSFLSKYGKYYSDRGHGEELDTIAAGSLHESTIEKDQNRKMKQEFLGFELLFPKILPTSKSLDHFVVDFGFVLQHVFNVENLNRLLMFPRDDQESLMILEKYQRRLGLPACFLHLSKFILNVLKPFKESRHQRPKYDKFRVPFYIELLSFLGISFKLIYKLIDEPVMLPLDELPSFYELYLSWQAKGFFNTHDAKLNSLEWLQKNIMETYLISTTTNTFPEKITELLKNLNPIIDTPCSEVERLESPVLEFSAHRSLSEALNRQLIAAMEDPYFSYRAADSHSYFHIQYTIMLLVLSHLSHDGYSPSFLHTLIKTNEILFFKKFKSRMKLTSI